MIALAVILVIIIWVVGWKNLTTARDTTRVYIEYGNEVYRDNLIKKIDEWKKGKGGN